ncbi:MAG: hypothetical protein RJA34_495, partial [Pseudomonadota bacterium]
MAFIPAYRNCRMRSFSGMRRR